MLKRFLILSVVLLLFWFSLEAAFAVNTAGLKDPVEVYGWGSVQVRKALVRLDTINSPLTILTPTSSNRICIVGAYWLEDHTTTITFMSGNNDEWVNIYDANQGYSHPPSADSYLYCTNPGEALKVKATAVVNTMMLDLIETNRVILRRP